MITSFSEGILNAVSFEKTDGPRDLNGIISQSYAAMSEYSNLLGTALAEYIPDPGSFRYLDLVLSRHDIGFAVANGFEEDLWKVLCSDNLKARHFLLSLPDPQTANAVLMRNKSDWGQLVRSRFDFVTLVSFANEHSSEVIKRNLALFLLGTLEDMDLGFAESERNTWRILLASMLVSIAPSVDQFHRRPLKLAVLISGQIRPGFKDSIEALLGALPDAVEADLFLSTWLKTGISKRTAEGTAPEAELSATVLEDEGMVSLFKHIDIEDEDSFDFTSNQAKQHYKLWRCFEVADRAEGYDLCLRLRPDLLLLGEIPAAVFDHAYTRAISPYSLLSVAGQAVRTDMHAPYLYMSDNIALGRPCAYASYADTWNSADKMKEKFPREAPQDWYGHVSLCCSLLAAPILVTRCADFPKFKLL